ncbi:unnamed protein product [Rhizophagus irregularis]|uniref:Uncharacterized protein n=1 Tax=Rhizophagus irregularis TaxID=588596 RepID=A0A2N1NAS3_9GLOM|nr:hypothetical protein RhiirC2_745402 [Rhizophagus irregularis]CAB4391677.1 unnamed protein product [Rhizophagus irregularis]CAB5392476.1 unnamed protein product [Rhizophagus irregularis]
MNFYDKFLRNFVILVVFATLTISLPISLNKRLSTDILIVTAPSPIPKFVGSIQTVSWICITCKPTDDVKIEIIKNLSKVVFTTTGKNANSGTQNIKLDPSWAVPGAYNVKVSLQSNPKVFGISIKPFPIIPVVSTNINIPANFPVNFPKSF